MSFLINPFVYLSAGATLTADKGTFTLTGVNASFLRQLKMAAGAGTFTLTGNDAGLINGNPDLVAETGTFTLTGNAAALTRALRMAAAAGSFSLTGNDAALSKTFNLLASSGSFTLTGVDAAFKRSLVMAAAAGSFTLTGNDATLTGPATAMPTFVAAGSFGSSTGSMSPGLPAGWQENDIFLLFVMTRNRAVSEPSGWTEVTNSPQGHGTADSSASSRLTTFWRRATASESGPTVGDAGICALICAFRGCPTSGDPWDVTAGNTEGPQTSVNFPTVTTSGGNRLVVLAAARNVDNTPAWLSGSANANLANITERFDNGAASSTGGGLAVVTGEKASAGSVGTTTATSSVSAYLSEMTIALKGA